MSNREGRGRDPGATTTCPRCGGDPAPRRTPTAQNPFLPKSKALTCSLCGLEYEKGTPAWQPGGGDPGPKAADGARPAGAKPKP